MGMCVCVCTRVCVSARRSHVTSLIRVNSGPVCLPDVSAPGERLRRVHVLVHTRVRLCLRRRLWGERRSRNPPAPTPLRRSWDASCLPGPPKSQSCARRSRQAEMGCSSSGSGSRSTRKVMQRTPANGACQRTPQTQNTPKMTPPTAS